MAEKHKRTRYPEGKNVHNYRVKEGNVTIDLSFVDPGEMVGRLCDILIEELTPVFNTMEAEAKELCPVGSIIREGNDPTHRRKPGTLRNSIKSTVTRRKDKTAVLGFLEAGNDDAYYAIMVEFGVTRGVGKGRERSKTYLWKPYFRTAFNNHVGEARTAVARGLQRFSEGR